MQDDHSRRRTKARHIRIPAFLPVPLRGRRDGWTPFRQAVFLVALARTGSVAAAAGEAGLSRVSAYQLRKRAGAESFAASWDAVQAGTMVPLRKFTPEERRIAAIEGLVKPIVWRGRCVAIARKCDGSALLGLFRRLSARAGKEDLMALEAGAFQP